MGVSTAAGHRTTIDRVSTDRQRVGIEAKVRHIVGGSCHHERVGRVGGNFHTVLRPVRERVALVGRGRKRGGGKVLVAASAAHRTTRHRTGRSRDVVTVGIKESNEVGADDRLYVAWVVNITIIPLYKVVTRVGRSRQRGFGTMGVCTAAGHITALFRTGGDGQRVGVDLKVCHEISGSRYGERVGCAGGDFRTAHRPVHKVVARVGSGNQRGGRIVVIVACASHITACRRIGCGVNGIAVGQEGCRYRHIGGGHDKGIARHFNRSQFRSYIP